LSILAKILADKGPEVQAAMREHPASEVEAIAKAAPQTRDFAAALRRGNDEPMRFICEFKRASPSAGAIAAGAEPEPIVRAYEEAGASAISVLTDRVYFDGRLEFLSRVRETVKIPVLRKDFIVHPYQIAEARAHGADAVLLIVSALETAQLSELYQCAREWGLRALIEVHDENEAERAAAIGAEIIGVNHRNLATFEIDLGLTARLARSMPADCILVGESGIRGRDDVVQLRDAGAHAVLIGESLMRAKHPGTALLEMRDSNDTN
tara:strand:- start:29912 stop:30709 length:798 start_codon:yes stop_codon:yes gene_type:complete